MKKQNKIIIISLFLTILIGIIFVTGADEIITKFTSTISMDKVNRDYLLTKIPTVMDKGQPLPKEISPVVNIECNEDYCKWSAVQDGIIQTYDNVIVRKYCIEMGNSSVCRTYGDKRVCLEYEQVCLRYEPYTPEEIETQVANQINNMLSSYATESMKSNLNPYVKVSEGTITIVEKR